MITHTYSVQVTLFNDKLDVDVLLREALDGLSENLCPEAHGIVAWMSESAGIHAVYNVWSDALTAAAGQ